MNRTFCIPWLITLASSLIFSNPAAPEPAPEKKLRVVVFGAHPDDPESGCGGLVALLTKPGHEVTLAYATCFRGERKIGDEAEAVVRRREATAACQMLGAKPYFFDYAHEKLQANEAALNTVAAWLKKIQSDIVVTHWPLDTHPNHHVTSRGGDPGASNRGHAERAGRGCRGSNHGDTADKHDGDSFGNGVPQVVGAGPGHG